MTNRDEWNGCYDEGWKGIIVEEAFSHPAKVSYALAARIYQHAFDNGWLKTGDTVVDPFGGIGGTAIHAAIRGVQWIGCELEPKFHGLAEQNFELWRSRWGHSPDWVQPVIHCGDSRRLCDVLGMAQACISSPPYSEGLGHGGSSYKECGAGGHRLKEAQVLGYGTTDGQLGSMPEGNYSAIVSSPPFSGTEQPCASQTQALKDYESFKTTSKRDSTLTGRVGAVVSSPPYSDQGQQSGSDTPARLGILRNGVTRGGDTRFKYADESTGQLGAMKEGEPPAAIVSSPPYSESTVVDGRSVTDAQTHTRPIGDMSSVDHGYGTTNGQLGAMVVGSPPFEGSLPGEPRNDNSILGQQQRGDNRLGETSRTHCLGRSTEGTYGCSEGNIGNQSGETFWSASKIIVQQCHQILRDGGVAIWITKDFVRKGQRVPFSDQWLALCESLGFQLVCRHRAMLVKRGDRQKLLEGGEHQTEKSRKSFFRRLAEKNGSPRIDWEDVICVRKVSS